MTGASAPSTIHWRQYCHVAGRAWSGKRCRSALSALVRRPAPTLKYLSRCDGRVAGSVAAFLLELTQDGGYMKDKKRNLALQYSRKAVWDDEESGRSLGAQEEACKEYAAKVGLVVVSARD